MPNCIARIFELLFRLLLPDAGRHRRTVGAVADQHGGLVTVGLPVSPPCVRAQVRAQAKIRAQAQAQVRVPILNDEEIGLVRPYAAAHDRRQRERRQRAGRRELWFAPHGIYIGQRLIHRLGVSR